MIAPLLLQFTVHRSPFTVCYLLTVTSNLWLTVDSAGGAYA